MLSAIANFVNSLVLTVASFLEREAGLSLVSYSIIVFGVLISDTAGRTKVAHDLVVFGLGVMARSMGGTKRLETRP